MPKAPGTWASLAATLSFKPLMELSPHGLGILWALFLTLTALGVFVGGQLEKSLALKDPQWIVIDEICGQWLTLLIMLAPGVQLGWMELALGFALFRLLDIKKPGPIDRVQHLPGGWGIMLDDLLAGLVAGAGAAVLLAIIKP